MVHRLRKYEYRDHTCDSDVASDAREEGSEDGVLSEREKRTVGAHNVEGYGAEDGEHSKFGSVGADVAKKEDAEEEEYSKDHGGSTSQLAQDEKVGEGGGHTGHRERILGIF